MKATDVLPISLRDARARARGLATKARNAFASFGAKDTPYAQAVLALLAAHNEAADVYDRHLRIAEGRSEPAAVAGTALHARIAALEAALRPLATLPLPDGPWHDARAVVVCPTADGDHVLTIVDLRRARRLLGIDDTCPGQRCSKG